MSDYLFGDGDEPDPEIERFEKLLSPLKYRGALPELPALPARAPRRRSRARVWVAGAAAIAVAAMILIGLFWIRPWRAPVKPNAPEAPSWAMTVHGQGVSIHSGVAIAPINEGAARLAVGAWVETNQASAELEVAGLGVVALAPGTRARIVDTGTAQQAIELDVGAVTARIEAPPRRFAVRTKHVTAIDLGCAFTLSVDKDGHGKLVVTAGSVALADRAAREVVVPAGAACALDEHGPGAPWFTDAAPAFRDALAHYEAHEGPLSSVLKEARSKDRLTLKALLTTANAEDRNSVTKRMAEFDAPPKAAPKKAPKHKAAAAVLKAAPVNKTVTAPPPAKQQPAKKAEPSTGLHHDALKDLERSAQ